MEQMVYIVSVVFTCLALLIIPVIIVTRRLSVRLSFKNILRFIKLVASQLDDEEENNEKSGTIGEEDKRRRLPKHVAIILDGNRRWAEKRGLGTSEGHQAGARRLIENAKDCFAMGINTVSLFAFSTENWARPEDEVNGLMALFEKHLRSEMAFFRSDEGTYVAGEEGTPKGLLRELMPRHVAVIMDGNRRWAERAGLLTSQGHEAGAKRLIEFSELCFKLGIETVSAFAFSTENWGRHKIEVKCLMSLFQRYLKSKIQFFQSEEIRVSVIGNLEKIPESLLGTIKETEQATKRYKKKHLILAIDYSGRSDILHACKSIVKKSQQGLIRGEDVDETLFERELLTKCTEFPSPDLLIRTSGEQRISNFLLWQLAYTELFFSPVLWPDFDKDRVIEALVSYQRRERRFGCRI